MSSLLHAKPLGGAASGHQGVHVTVATVSDADASQAVAAGARKHGAKIYQKAEVTKLDLQSDGSWEVHTAEGSIRAKRVVNATGKDATTI